MTNSSTLPCPQGHKILILKQKPKDVTQGGIILPDAAKEAEAYLMTVAKVIKVGPLAYMNKETGVSWKGGPWAKEGDWVIIPRFTQFKMEIEGEEYRFINDDEIIATIDDPESVKVYS